MQKLDNQCQQLCHQVKHLAQQNRMLPLTILDVYTIIQKPKDDKSSSISMKTCVQMSHIFPFCLKLNYVIFKILINFINIKQLYRNK